MCDYPVYRNFATAHKFSKRTIVRGIQFPDLNDGYKERPGLVISDIDNCPGYFGGVGITLVPLKSLPYNHFDIPIMNAYVYGREKISYISCNDQYHILFTEKNKYRSTSAITCPDIVFDLVLKVKKLQLKGTRKAYEKAIQLVKEYRLEFMNVYNVKSIRYGITQDIMYELYPDGTEKYFKMENAHLIRETVEEFEEGDEKVLFDTIDIEEPEQIQEHEKIEESKPEKPIKGKQVKEKVPTVNKHVDIKSGTILEDDTPQSVYVDEHAHETFNNAFSAALMKMNPAPQTTYPVPKKKPSAVLPKTDSKTAEKKDEKSSRVRVSKCSDEELLNFVKIINNSDSAYEVGLKLGVTSSTVANRFKQTMKEFERRGMQDRIIEWPFTKGPR